MSNKESSNKKFIRHVIRHINELWLNKKYDEICELLSEHLVNAPPWFKECIDGRETYAQSYHEYDQSAMIRGDTPVEAEIDRK
jgi:hypothetical protein